MARRGRNHTMRDVDMMMLRGRLAWWASCGCAAAGQGHENPPPSSSSSSATQTDPHDSWPADDGRAAQDHGRCCPGSGWLAARRRDSRETRAATAPVGSLHGRRRRDWLARHEWGGRKRRAAHPIALAPPARPPRGLARWLAGPGQRRSQSSARRQRATHPRPRPAKPCHRVRAPPDPSFLPHRPARPLLVRGAAAADEAVSSDHIRSFPARPRGPTLAPLQLVVLASDIVCESAAPPEGWAQRRRLASYPPFFLEPRRHSLG